jgi:hypothetical protein
MSKRHPTLPPSVARSLRTLGRDINDARRRRRISEAVLADRALMARGTLRRVCAGDPGASMGAYASVLFALGLSERLVTLAAASNDAVGLRLEEERLPKRIRQPRPRGTSPKAPGSTP